MALAYLTINLDAFTGDDHPPCRRTRPSRSTPQTTSTPPMT